MLASSLSSQQQEGNPSISSHLLATSTPFLSPLRQQQTNRIHSPIFPSLSTSALTAPTSNTTIQPSQNSSIQQIGNNILILSHFCEKEGPSVLFSTQQIPIPIYSKTEDKVIDEEQFDLQEDDMEENYPTTLQQKLDDLFQKNKSIIHRVEFSSVDVKYLSQPFSPSESNVAPSHSHTPIFKSDEELERKKHLEESNVDEEDVHSSGSSSDDQENIDQQSAMHHFDEEDELATTIRDHVVHASQHQPQLPLFHIDSPLKLFEENNAEPIVYLSSHSVNSNYSAYLKSLCLRALSVEYIGPGKEGAVSFGDAQQGYHFVYVFKLKDCRARGFARWFAFILIHPLCMQNVTMCWNFFSQTFGKMVKQLKQKSQEIFNHEYSQVNKSHSSSTSVFNINNTKKSSEPLRDLSSLLQNPFFFEQLHQFQCGVLKAFHEKLIPVTCKWSAKTKQVQYKYYGSPQTKEEAVDEEWEQPECEKYAWKHIEFEEEEARLHFENRLNQQNRDEESFASIRSLYQFTMLVRDYYFGYSKHKQQQQTHPYHTLAEEGEDDDLLNQHPLSDTEDESHDDTASSVSSNSRTSRQSNLQNTKSTTKERKQKEELVNQAIRTLINNVILGNQVIIRSNHMDLANDICKLFIQLVPSTCVKASFGCKKYKPSYLANFITCFSDTFLPESHIDYSCSCLLDIRGNFQGFSQFTIRHDSSNTSNNNTNNNSNSSSSLNNSNTTSSTTFQYTLSIEEICFQNYFKHLPNHGSTLAQDRPSFYQKIEEKMLRHLKQEWITKAKLLIKFAKMKQQHGEMQQQQLLYQSIEKFCKIIKVKKSEIPVLQYFATGQWKRL